MIYQRIFALHLLIPLVKGLVKGTSEKFGLIYLDAHADFYAEMGGQSLSHATTLRRIVNDELVELENVVAHDLRMALPQQRVEIAGKEEVPFYDAVSFSEAVQEMAKRVDKIYLSIDMDVLAPEVAPGVSHPESGGLTMVELMKFLRASFLSRKVQHVDIVEMNPTLDQSNLTAIAARDILKEVLTGFAYQKST